MPDFHIWVGESAPAPSGFVNPEVCLTSEPITAATFTEAVQAYVDGLPVGQQGLWVVDEAGVWSMGGCQVLPVSAALAAFEDEFTGPVLEEPEYVDTGLPEHELWVSSTVVPEDVAEPVVMLTPEPIKAESFDAAVQIFKEHLCDPVTAEALETTEVGWTLAGAPVADCPEDAEVADATNS